MLRSVGDASELVLADGDSLLGQLQRGRGAGWLAAVDDPVRGRADLLTCLADDPRWDRQVESRSDYYATLAIALNVAAAEIAALVRSDDDWLPRGTLEAMAERGAVDAADVIDDLKRRYPDSDPLRDERHQDEWISTPPPPPTTAPIDVLLASLPHGPIPKAVLHRLRLTRDPTELAALRVASQDPSGPGFRLAMEAIGGRGDTDAIPTVTALLATDPIGIARSASIRYLKALPSSATLPLAREWARLPGGRGDVAQMLLSDHAEAEDIPLVLDLLHAATHNYAICSLVDALARVPSLGPHPELQAIFTEINYSYGRRRAAIALAATDPEFAQTFAFECLWDCESETRAIGCEAVPLDDRSIPRLRAIADDPVENATTRTAATLRLRTLDQP